MKHFIMIWIAVLALFSTALVSVQADDQPATVSLFVSCIENPSESGLPRVWFGYQSSAVVNGAADYGPSDGAGFIGAPPNTLQAGRHDRVFAVELQTEGVKAFYEFQTADGRLYSVFADASTKAPKCGAVYQPGAPSIAVVMTTDCAFVEIQDPYGHWWRVTDKDHPDGILLHYGEALIGGQDQSTNPDDYRAVATACF